MLIYSLILLLSFLTSIVCKIDMERILSNQPCNFKSQCLPNSSCVEGFCKCDEGFVLLKNQTHYECLRPVGTIYEKCEKDVVCIVTLSNNSYCEESEGRCECKDDSHFDKESNRCFKTVALGGECIESKQCLLPDNTYAFCQFGKCTCDINQHLTEDGRCVTSVPLEGRCHTDENCQHVDAICKGGICKCGTGRVVSDNGTVCIEAAAEFGDECIQLSQCTSYLNGAICLGGKCTCNSGWHPYGISCYKSSLPGENCNDPIECYTDGNTADNVACYVGVCKCLNGDPTVGKCPSARENPSSGSKCLVTAALFAALIITVSLSNIF